MKKAGLSFIIFLIITAVSVVYYLYVINRLKRKRRLLTEAINSYTENFKAEGLDKYYESLDTKKLVSEYKEIINVYGEAVDQQEKLAELGSKENLITDVLTKRGLDIDQLINVQPYKAHTSRRLPKESLEIVSFKATSILSYIFLEILMFAGITVIVYDMYTRIFTYRLGWSWLANKDNLLEGLFLLLFVYSFFALLKDLKKNIYTLIMGKDAFTYKHLFRKTLPYSAVSEIRLVNYAGRGGHEIQMLQFIVNNQRKIEFRLDHLGINSSDEVIRPSDPRYLKVRGNEQLILDFLEFRTAKPVVRVNGGIKFF